MIYALKASSDWCNIRASLEKGEGRFGWSYIKTADLRQLSRRIDEKGWDNLSDKEKDCYQRFLLDFEEGDYVIYINVPEWGNCIVAKVAGPYEWRFEDSDFNHRFPVDRTSVYAFDRNDAIVPPALRSRLKLQGRWWRIRLEEEFQALLKSLQKGFQPTPRTSKDNLRFLSTELQPFLASITQLIHHSHPNYDLEPLFADVLRKIPGVIDVRRQGGAGDHGADILATFEGGLPIPGLEKDCTLVVQVKSFTGEHWETQAVEDIRRAFEHYPEASMGLIISTASTSTTALDDALDQLKEKSGKPVALLIGPDVAAFVLRFGAKLLG
jgi:Restriction endonuclease